jgi:hypothetical protein
LTRLTGRDNVSLFLVDTLPSRWRKAAGSFRWGGPDGDPFRWRS